MTKVEFARIVAYLEAGCGKSLTKEGASVYFDLLGDLDRDVLQAAARMVLLEHPWPSIPSVAELRQAAATIAQGHVSRLTSAEAWGLAWKAAGRIDPERADHENPPTHIDREFAKLPALVVKAIRVYGLCAMCYGNEPVGIIRAQFMRIYEELSESDARMALLPLALKESVKQIGEHPCPQVNAVVAALPSIGSELPTAR